MNDKNAIDKLAAMSDGKLVDALKQFADGATIRSIRGISDAEMEAIYAVGVNFYTAGNFADAEKVFKFLTLFDHLNSRYWTAMGSLRQAQRRFDEALEAYKMAGFLDLENPRPAYYAAECLVALGRKDEALGALDALAAYARKDDETAREYLAKAAKLRELAGR